MHAADDARRLDAHPLRDLIRNNVREVFYRADNGCKGYLDRSELEVALRGLLGYLPSEFELDQIEAVAAAGGQKLTLAVFSGILAPRLARLHQNDMIREMFLALDAGGRGYITLSDLREASKCSAPFVPEEVVELAFGAVDNDGDGKVSFREFEAITRLRERSLFVSFRHRS
ncbi:hypothetical protein DFJ73DRAFT_42092 [Zopfochytrium polystomum]|nr:hypothetical protein DFJ73DRAFT_42092 [Zopfochytrium polystomum]